MKTIKVMADKLWRRGAFVAVEPQELIDVAVMEVLRARSRFDPSRAKWTTFAVFRARGAMLDELRALDHVPRLMRARANKGAIELKKIQSIDNPSSDLQPHLMADRRDPGPLATAAGRDFWRGLPGIVGRRSVEVLDRYYRPDQTLLEIGRALGLSESRVCQLHARAIARLRRRMGERSE